MCPNVDINGVCGLTAEEAGKLSEQELCEYVVCQWASSTRQAACLYCVSKEGMKHLHIVLCGNNPIGQLLGRIIYFSYCYRVNRPDGAKKGRDGHPADFYRFTITGENYRNMKDSFTEGTKIQQIQKAAGNGVFLAWGKYL